MELPDNFNKLCIMLDKFFIFDDILFVRQMTGGEFLDKLFLDKINITRILYETNNPNQPKRNKGPNTLIQHGELKNTLEKINKKFDLICLDPFHEYYESSSDISLLTQFLTDDGILICHDCGVNTNKSLYTPHFKKGGWCGVTYCCFVEFALNNPDYFYGVINRDYGLGIISKKNMKFVKKINNEKQKIFIDIFKKNVDEAFDYFKNYGSEIINLIS